MKDLTVMKHRTSTRRAYPNFAAMGMHLPRALTAVLVVGLTIVWGATAPVARQDPLLAEALEAHNLGDVKKAVEVYTEYLEKNPNSAEAYNWRGMAYDDLGESDKALADFNRAIELSPKYSEPYNNRGEVYRKKKDYGKAAADYHKAIELEKNFAEPRFNIALLQEAQGQPYLAARSLLAYLRVDPDAADRKQVLLKIRQLVQTPPSAPATAEQVAQKPAPPSAQPSPSPQAAAKPTVPQAGAQPPGGEPKKKFTPGMPVTPPAAKTSSDVSGLLPPELPLVGGVLALMLGMGIVALAIPLLFYLFIAFMLFLIARKTNTNMPWLAFIPVANVYLMVLIAGKPVWWFAAVVVPGLLAAILTGSGLLPDSVASIVSGLASLVAIVLLLPIFLGIAAARGKAALWAILAWLPCTHPIGMAYLGLSR